MHRKPITNSTVADLLRRYAAALVVQGADRFKVKAYRRAVETIESLDASVAELAANEARLRELPGIGKAISGMIQQIVTTGKLPPLEKSISQMPPELIELATRPALDPKKVLRIYKKLKIGSLAELRARLESGEIGAALGPRLEFHVRQGLDDRPRMLLRAAERPAAMIEHFLKKTAGVTRFSRAGSLRRKRDTVADVKFLVSGRSAAAIFKRFAQFGAVQSTAVNSQDEVTYTLSSGLAVTLAWTRRQEWGLNLLLHTGSSAHLAELQEHADASRVTLSAKSLAAEGINIEEEADLYEGLGLEFIEPELREGRGEVQAAAEGKLPELITVADLRGDLHMHTTASDGADSLAVMAETAQARGYEYIAITDHSQSLKITNGLTEKRLLAHIKEIDKLNSRLKKFRIFKSAEVDILEDGRLDYSNGVLKELDFTICSIHSRFGLNREQQTARILRAMDNPYFNILGHATGRLLLKREGYGLDIEKLIKHAKQNHCFFEINSSPNRLDLSDEHAKLAKDVGLKIAVNTDAHSTSELDFIHGGINQARRAWLEAGDVLNTLPAERLLKALER